MWNASIINCFAFDTTIKLSSSIKHDTHWHNSRIKSIEVVHADIPLRNTPVHGYATQHWIQFVWYKIYELSNGDLKLHEIDLLAEMCPLALLQIGLVSILSGEVYEIPVIDYSFSQRWDGMAGNWIAAGPAPKVVLLSGILSFALNVSNFVANKVTSAQTSLTRCI